MKNAFVNSSLNIISKENEYNEIELKKLKYGLEGLYSFVTKYTIILLLNIILGNMIEFIIFHLCYSLCRAFGFGLHAKTNIGCWIVSTIVYVFIPFCIKNIVFPKSIIVFIALVSSFTISLFAPADTKKRPLRNEEKRKQDKILAIIICVIYLFLITSFNNFITYCLTYALLFESIMVNPITYKLFKQSYNNYKNMNV